MFSYTVMWGNSAYSWNTSGVLRLKGGNPFIRLPSTRTSPSSGSENPASWRIRVVLPQPEGPSSVTNAPFGICKDTWSRATKSSNFLTTFRNSI